MKKHLIDFIDAVIADDSAAEKAAFSQYMPEKTKSVLSEGLEQTHMFTDDKEPKIDGTKRYLVQPMGVSYDAPEQAASVAANNQKHRATVLDTETNELLDWKLILKQYAKQPTQY